MKLKTAMRCVYTMYNSTASAMRLRCFPESCKGLESSKSAGRCFGAAGIFHQGVIRVMADLPPPTKNAGNDGMGFVQAFRPGTHGAAERPSLAQRHQFISHLFVFLSRGEGTGEGVPSGADHVESLFLCLGRRLDASQPLENFPEHLALVTFSLKNSTRTPQGTGTI